ncbi:MAG TPA: hypothetical protein VN837_04720 [Chloroflexota bacterium]|nr:hypothetical protein [Chloroflexota bacterium]
MRWFKAALYALVVLVMATPTAAAASSTMHFRVFARTSIRLADIVWTGQRFLYIENTANRIVAAGPTGMPYTPFATLPRQVEETRCVVAAGGHGFTAGDLYCHTPLNQVYRLSADGKTSTLLATLPHVVRADGAIAFDTVGRLGYALIAATGRSGGGTNRGGSVFAVSPQGQTRLLGRYDDPGGADEIAVAPADFGSAAGQVLLAVDDGKTGTLVAMDAHGRTRTLLNLPDGPNPIVVLPPGQAPSGGPVQAGLYVTDTLSRDVFFAPAGDLAPFAGSVLVGSELGGLFWAIRPSGNGFIATKLSTNLTAKHYNLEGATYVAG